MARDLRKDLVGPSPSAQVALVVPTTFDSQILRVGNPAILALGNQGIALTICPNSIFNISQMQTRSCVLILWDSQSCPWRTAVDTSFSQIVNNMLQVIVAYMHARPGSEDWKPDTKTMVGSFILTAIVGGGGTDDGDDAELKEGFTVIPCGQKASLGEFRRVLDSSLLVHGSKLAVCVATANAEHLDALVALNLPALLLMTSANAKDTVQCATGGASTVICWNHVCSFHKSNAEIKSTLTTKKHWNEAGSAVEVSNQGGFALEKLSIETSSSDEHELPSRMSSRHRDVSEFGSGGDSDSDFTIITRGPPAKQVFRQPSAEAGDSEGWWHRATPPKPAELIGTVELRDATVAELFKNLARWGSNSALDRAEIAKNSANHWEIKVTGKTEEHLSTTIKLIDALVAAANKYSESRISLIDWCPKHLDAIMGSSQLSKALREANAAVLFSVSDKSATARGKGDSGVELSASICALDSEGLESIRDWLADLFPRKTQWKCPSPGPTAAQLSAFTVVAELSLHEPVDPTNRVVCIDAWGFGSSLNRAYEELVKRKNDKRSDTASIYQPPIPSMTTKVSSSKGSTQISGNTTGVISAASSPARKAGNLEARGGTGHSLKQKSSSSSFTFQDREAGVFYQAFEQEFREYMKEELGVDVVTSESSVGADSPQQQCKGSPSSEKPANFDARAPAVKVVISGSSSKDVLASKQYFDTFLNTTHLARCQVAFPRTSVEKYKELLLFKQSHDKRLRTVRLTANANSPIRCTNPMNLLGFINVRIKPPLHSKGIKRMQLPADVTVTLCGPYQSKVQLEALRDLERAFNGVPSDYVSAICELPATSPITRQLTVKVSREEFIKHHGLAGLKFDEGSKNKGGVAISKLWSPNSRHLAKVLDVIRQACPDTRIKHEAPMPSQLPEYEQSSPLFTSSAKSTTNNVRGSAGGNADGVGSGEFSGLGNAVPASLPPGLEGAAGLGLNPSSPSSPQRRSKSIIHWPHLSLRFVFLSDPFKETLTSIVSTYRSRGVTVTLPFRDKSDPTACMMLEGEQNLVESCSRNVTEYMSTILLQQRNVIMLLSGSTFSKLTANDLALLKEIQGRCGVHVILDPTVEEKKDAKWKYYIGALPKHVTLPSAQCSLSLSLSTSFAEKVVGGAQSSFQRSAIGSPIGSPLSSFSNTTGTLSSELVTPFSSLGAPSPLLGRFSPDPHSYSYSQHAPQTLFSSYDPSLSLSSSPAASQQGSAMSGANSWFRDLDLQSNASSLQSGLRPLTRGASFEIQQGQGTGQGGAQTSIKSSSHELLVTHVINKHAKCTVEVVVLSDSSGKCSGLGVECLLLVVDTDANVGLNTGQIASLNRGEPIIDRVDQDPLVSLSRDSTATPPSTMIRVRPVLVGREDPAAQAIALGSAVVNALDSANSIGLHGVAIVVPEPYSELLPSLSKDAIRRTVARKVLQFAHEKDAITIRRIVLREDGEAYISGGLLCCTYDENANTGSAFVSAILSHIEEETSQLLSFLDAKIVSATVPLPAKMPEDCVVGGGKNSILCVVRGQPESILRTVQELAEVSRRRE